MKIQNISYLVDSDPDKPARNVFAMKKYPVRFSRWVWGVTLVSLGVLAVALGWLFGFWGGPVGSWLLAIAIFLLIIALFIPIFFMPRYLCFNGEKLRLKCLAGGIRIPVERIRRVEACPTMCHSVRLFGSGGYFGYLGYFRGEGKGTYVAYVGDRDEMFWVETPRKNYLFSCGDRDELIERINGQLEDPFY